MKQLNAHQTMIQSIKGFMATASDAQLLEKKEILMDLVAHTDNELAKAATKCLHLIENEINDRKGG